MKIEPGQWTGPVESPYGLHLVLVRERVAGAAPALAEIRPQVEREVLAERRKKELDALYERLLQKYTVTIEKPRRRRRRPRPAQAGRGEARARRFCSLAGLVLAGAAPALAHEARPGFLELRETGPETYSFLWKKPTGGEVEIQIAPVIPKDCRLATSDRQQLSPGAVVVRGTLTCAGGLAGKTIAIAGLEATITDVLVRLHHADGRLESHLLRPATPSVTLGGVTTAGERALGYVQLGVQHILLGVDHLLFVLGLMLIVSDRWMLVKTITSFTLAHSITLAIATLGYASAPLPPLNAAIALSILFLGPEIVRTLAGRDELHDPPPVGGGVRLRAAARLRLRERPHLDGPAAGRDPARAAALQRGRRAGAGGVRAARDPARALVPRARGPLAAAGSSAPGLRGGHARRLLDDPAHAHPARRGRDDGEASPRRHRCDGAPLLHAPRCRRSGRRSPGPTPRRAAPRAFSPASITRSRGSTTCSRWSRSACGAPSSAHRRCGCCR